MSRSTGDGRGQGEAERRPPCLKKSPVLFIRLWVLDRVHDEAAHIPHRAPLGYGFLYPATEAIAWEQAVGIQGARRPSDVDTMSAAL